MSYRLDIWNQMLPGVSHLIEKSDVTSLEWTNWKFLFILKYHPLHKMHHPIGSIANGPRLSLPSKSTAPKTNANGCHVHSK